ncbi:hypothetical protein [Vibrio fluvialis]|uniref:hypothetical protein n=1 Tax=Vibrio fluvialis TaxID=676 RepID=UPI001F224C62|nr:hypothetical protein [Vibrio fluvialis]MCE7656940.1 hypothetical protein [Vibrio fluvialis]
MAVFCVSYDLNNPGQKYQKVQEVLKSYAGWIHLLDSTWLIAADTTPNQIIEALKVHIDSNDRVFISRVRVNEYSGWLTDEDWDWLRKHV